MIGIEHTRSMAARALAIAYIHELDMQKAREVADSITATLGRGSQIGAVAAEFITANEPFLAQELLAKLGETEEDAQAYRKVARAMIQKGLNADLVKWLETAPSPMARAYACMARCRTTAESIKHMHSVVAWIAALARQGYPVQ